jgi:glycine cleavage system H protein
MPDALQLTVDKFTFTIPADRLYSHAGVWVQGEGGRVRLGLSDFLQQHSGDVAFVEVTAAGTDVAVDDPVATVETIKVDIEVPAPVAGAIVAANPRVAEEAEIINQDPYGEGWLVEIETRNWEGDAANLLSPTAYLEVVRQQAEEEANADG